MSAAVIDLRRYALGLAGQVIPAEAWIPLTRAQELVDQANDALARLDEELAAERALAREQGHAEGRRTGLDEFAAATAALHAARERLAEQMRAEVTGLAVAVVERIAPSLGADRLVPLLAGEAVRQLSFEPNLVVRVHPDVAEATRQRLVADGVGLAGGASFEILPTPEFGPFDCLIETEGGVVRAGLREQLDQVRTILAVAQRSASPGDGQAIGLRERGDDSAE